MAAQTYTPLAPLGGPPLPARPGEQPSIIRPEQLERLPPYPANPPTFDQQLAIWKEQARRNRAYAISSAVIAAISILALITAIALLIWVALQPTNPTPPPPPAAEETGALMGGKNAFLAGYREGVRRSALRNQSLQGIRNNDEQECEGQQIQNEVYPVEIQGLQHDEAV